MGAGRLAEAGEAATGTQGGHVRVNSVIYHLVQVQTLGKGQGSCMMMRWRQSCLASRHVGPSSSREQANGTDECA